MKNLISFLTKKNFSTYNCGIDYTYKSQNECLNNCDICRCGKIIDLKISNIDKKTLVNYLLSTLKQKTVDKLDLYCVDRIIRYSGICDPNNWTINVQSGYYGEEIGNCEVNNELLQNLIKNLELLDKLSSIDKMKFILNIEYGYLTDVVSIKTNVFLLNINIDKIDLFNKNYMHKLNIKHVNEYNDYNLPRAICHYVNDQCVVIDGYHRMVSANNQKLKSVEVILLT